MFGRYDYGRYQSGSCYEYTIGYQNQPKTIYAPFYYPQEAHSMKISIINYIYIKKNHNN